MIAKKKKANKMKRLASQLEKDFKTTSSLAETVNDFKEKVNKKIR